MNLNPVKIKAHLLKMGFTNIEIVHTKVKRPYVTAELDGVPYRTGYARSHDTPEYCYDNIVQQLRRSARGAK